MSDRSEALCTPFPWPRKLVHCKIAAPPARETWRGFGRFRCMDASHPRRRYRPGFAALVLFAVIMTLAAVVIWPTKFFQAPAVQSDASCTVRHCPSAEDRPRRSDMAETPAGQKPVGAQ